MHTEFPGTADSSATVTSALDVISGEAGEPARDSFAQRSIMWLVSSVRRDALATLHDFVQRFTNHQLWVINSTHIPLKIDIEFPEKVGVDRLLAALAASQATLQRPCIVIQAGSAVTVDLVARHSTSTQLTPQRDNSADTFCGGAIMPGVPMILRLLGKGADMLPELDADDLTDLPNLPGKNTEQAMLAGAASCLVGGAIHLVHRYRKQWGMETPVIISGGDGMRLAPFIDSPHQVKPHLVEHGLLELATRHASNLISTELS